MNCKHEYLWEEIGKNNIQHFPSGVESQSYKFTKSKGLLRNLLWKIVCYATYPTKVESWYSFGQAYYALFMNDLYKSNQTINATQLSYWVALYRAFPLDVKLTTNEL